MCALSYNALQTPFVIVEFTEGEAGSDCKDGTLITDVSECRRAANHFDHITISNDFIESNTEYIEGCYTVRDQNDEWIAYFNENFHGSKNEWAGVKPICYSSNIYHVVNNLIFLIYFSISILLSMVFMKKKDTISYLYRILCLGRMG